MCDPLTPAEQAAIASYTGPITICEPRTFTDAANIKPLRKYSATALTNAHKRERQKGESTKAMIRECTAQGLTITEISRQCGVTETTVRIYSREMGL